MILWTLQHPVVWQALQQNGSWTADNSQIVFPEDEDTYCSHSHYAYLWLVRQMTKRIGPSPEGVDYPIWAWKKQWGRNDGMPDMRTSIGPPGEPCVRMKIDVPDELVLLSDFDDWHSPLNYWYLSKTEQESQDFDDWYKSMGFSFFDLSDFTKSSPDLIRVREHIEKSWEYMFDLDELRDPYWHSSPEKQSVQATFWELKIENVLSVESFKYR